MIKPFNLAALKVGDFTSKIILVPFISAKSNHEQECCVDSVRVYTLLERKNPGVFQSNFIIFQVLSVIVRSQNM